MTEFNTKALSVVDKFFGDDLKHQQTNQSSVEAHGRPPTRKEHRLGVGVPSQQANKETSGLDFGKRILQVGKKRGLQQQAEDDEVNEKSDHDSDEEEDLGRTSIVETTLKKQKTTAPSNEPLTSKKRKQKKTKNDKASKVADTDSQDDLVNTNDMSSNDALGLVIDRTGIDLESVAAESAKPNLRKRKKVRSRQKNIYKDKREHKPEHLIPGSKNYKGKPITPETRKKLNLPSK
jgi:hypothetical protein